MYEGKRTAEFMEITNYFSMTLFKTPHKPTQTDTHIHTHTDLHTHTQTYGDMIYMSIYKESIHNQHQASSKVHNEKSTKFK